MRILESYFLCDGVYWSPPKAKKKKKRDKNEVAQGTDLSGIEFQVQRL